MRKHILLMAILPALIFSCTDESYENAPMNNLAHYENVVFEDYDKLPANSMPALNGYFTPKHTAPSYLETWLNNNYFSVDVGSTMSLIYDFMDYTRADSLDLMTRPLTIIGSRDYRSVWGTPFVEAFTPAKPASQHLPVILENNETSAKEGEYRVTQFNYSPVEPTIESNREVIYYSLDFETVGGTFWDELKVPNSYSLELTGIGRKWRVFEREGVKGMFGYHNTVRAGDAWFITEQIDLGAAENPTFSVDIGIGYYLNDFLKVYIGDGSFNGSDPLTSGGWIDVTDDLQINSLPKVTGYPTLTTVSMKIPESLVGRTINIAFRDHVPESDVAYTAPTLYAVDNIKVFETRAYASVPSTTPEWAVYTYKGLQWIEKSNILILQKEDYDAAGSSYLPIEQAHAFIPELLQTKFADSVEGEEIVVVYKQTEAMSYAENYQYTSGKWSYEELPPTQKKTANFIYKSLDEMWKFVE